MLVIEDTPSKMVLKTDNSVQSTPPLSEGCLLPAFGTTAALIIFVVLIWFRASYFIPGNRWLLPVVITVAVVIEVILIAAVAFFVSIHRDRVKEATVSMDADQQRSTRVERLNSGKVNQLELKFAEVTHVLVHGENLGHRLIVSLESADKPSLEVNADVFFNSQPMEEFGKKLGRLVQKPVVFKITDAGKLLSEETIQE